MLALLSCDPAAITYIELLREERACLPDSSSVAVSTTDMEAVTEEVALVATKHGLAQTDGYGGQAWFSRRWDYVDAGHPISISIRVNEMMYGPNSVEIEVFEWLSFGHSDFGEAVLDDLTAGLCIRFGEDRVSTRR